MIAAFPATEKPRGGSAEFNPLGEVTTSHFSLGGQNIAEIKISELDKLVDQLPGFLDHRGIP